jgi:hypothetical protein
MAPRASAVPPAAHTPVTSPLFALASGIRTLTAVLVVVALLPNLTLAVFWLRMIDIPWSEPVVLLPNEPWACEASPSPRQPRRARFPDDREDLQDRRKPSIQLDKEPTIVVGKPDPALHLTLQYDQLMSECHVLCFKPALRLEWRGQDSQNGAEQGKHCALTLGDSFS